MHESCLSIYFNCVCFYRCLSRYIGFRCRLPDRLYFFGLRLYVPASNYSVMSGRKHLYTVHVIIVSKALHVIIVSKAQIRKPNYSLQLKCLGITHHRNFRDLNACVVHIFVLLKNKTAAILTSRFNTVHCRLSRLYTMLPVL